MVVMHDACTAFRVNEIMYIKKDMMYKYSGVLLIVAAMAAKEFHEHSNDIPVRSNQCINV